MQNTMLKITKGIRNSLLILILSSSLAYADRDITNFTFKPSVAYKKEHKSYYIVNSESGEPTIGKKSYKFVAMPFDCGSDDPSDGSRYSDCGGKYDQYGNGGDRVRSELSGKPRFGSNNYWLSFSVYLPENYVNISPTITSFYQVYSGSGKGPNLKIEDKSGTIIYNRFYKYNTIQEHKLFNIKDMRGKWTHFKINAKFSDKKDKGFIKIWVNDELKADVKGITAAGPVGKGHYVKAGLYQTGISRYLKVLGENLDWKKGQQAGKFPTQIIYMDNIFKANSEEKLEELIKKAS